MPAIAVVGLLAASVLLVLVFPEARRLAGTVLRPTDHQAQRVELARGTDTTPFAELGPRPRRPASQPPADAEHEPEELEPPIEEVGPELPPAPRPRAPEPEEAAPADPLRELDAEALELWRQGDISRAEQTFRKLIDRAGASERAELAFGDLFTIAHKVHGPRRRVALWREYLGMFPHGRFADDARAGLCRHAEEHARPACWAAYLVDFAEGSYRAEAERATAADAGDTR